MEEYSEVEYQWKRLLLPSTIYQAFRNWLLIQIARSMYGIVTCKISVHVAAQENIQNMHDNVQISAPSIKSLGDLVMNDTQLVKILAQQNPSKRK